RSTVFLLNDRRLPQRHHRFQHLLGLTHQRVVRRQFFGPRHHERRAPAQPHSVGSLRRAVQLHAVRCLSAPCDRALGIHQIFVDRGESSLRRHRRHVGVLLVQTRYIFQRFFPVGLVDFQRRRWFHGNHLRRLREVIPGIWVRAELLHRRLLLRQRLSRGLICFVRCQPDLVAQRDRIVVQRQNTGLALASAEVAVLFVIPDAHYHSQDAHV